MLGTLKLLWVAISGNKLVSYIVLGTLALGAILAVFASVRSQGADKERSKQLADALSSLQKEAQRRAEIDALDSATARSQLRNKWSSS